MNFYVFQKHPRALILLRFLGARNVNIRNQHIFFYWPTNTKNVKGQKKEENFFISIFF